MTANIIFLSLGDSPQNREMTELAISTLQESETHVEFNIFVVESYKNFLKDEHRYEGATVIIPQEPFNFNRFLKYGIDIAKMRLKAEWTILANNDLIFHRHWMTEVLTQNQITGIRSFGAWSDQVHGQRFPGSPKAVIEGYRIGYEYTGWIQIFRTDLLETLEFDERCLFWFSDNLIADQLRARGERHALLRDCQVTHLESATINKFDRAKLDLFTIKQKQNYYKKNKPK